MIELVRDVMTLKVETLAPDTPLHVAARKMKDLNIGSLPVCEGLRIVGILTDRDIVLRAVAEGLDALTTVASTIMTRDPVTVLDTSYLGEAEWVMREKQLRRLPVVNDRGELVGYLAMARVALTEDIESAGRLLRGISGDRPPSRRNKTA